MDCWDGTFSQLLNFQQITGITYPLLLNASNVCYDYGVQNDFTVVIDQQGIIRYVANGVNVPALQSVIESLLPTGIEDSGSQLPPKKPALYQNYPNPFNPRTTIEFYLPEGGEVSLKIYNLRGETVSTLVSENLPAGNHKYSWDANGLSSGVYFYRLRSRRAVQTRKMLLVE